MQKICGKPLTDFKTNEQDATYLYKISPKSCDYEKLSNPSEKTIYYYYCLNQELIIISFLDCMVYFWAKKEKKYLMASFKSSFLCIKLKQTCEKLQNNVGCWC